MKIDGVKGYATPLLGGLSKPEVSVSAIRGRKDDEAQAQGAASGEFVNSVFTQNQP